MAVTQAQFERKLLEKLQEVGFELNKKDVQEILEIQAATVRESLKAEFAASKKMKRDAKKNGDNGKVPNPVVVVRGLGRFTIRHYPARTGRNPQTGQPMKIKAKDKMRVAAPKALKDSIGV